jgi:hypothetical protein
LVFNQKMLLYALKNIDICFITLCKDNVIFRSHEETVNVNKPWEGEILTCCNVNSNLLIY